MTTRLIAPPVGMAVSLSAARTAARLNGSDFDAELEIDILAITEDAEFEMQRAIITRSYLATLDRFEQRIRLAPSPLQSVTSIRYLDSDGVERTVPKEDYFVNSVATPGWVEPAIGKQWPAALLRTGAVNVEFISGYGANDGSTPAPIKKYLLAKIKEAYAPAGTATSPHLVRLLDPFKVYS
ncbi:hypothetical protein INH39_02875 [Massilia violaceinigra]|uniref:Phage gp6-like head-tail connector protein n=1 Tax=Massilia violaceinigra TaxID=2045208 RepID=A0ABY4A7F8_9BURK|nr:hypothetical protein [Massilia violaceinigra]UOD30707.1 hypothetical protein INH39_02875 [Massilia violaceinigra]